MGASAISPGATAPVDKGLTTAVLLCGDLARLGSGLNMVELCSSLENLCQDTTTDVVPGLCRNLEQLSTVVARRGAARAVLGMCSGEYSSVELQVRARKASLDPFGLEVVPLGTLCALVHPEPQSTWKAEALLAAAVARARAFQGSDPENTKPYFLPLSQKVTRRSLFTVPPIGYQPVPSIAEERCAADARCQLCVRACPRDALRKAGGQLLLDKTRCEGCGVCLAVCPREAIDFPGWSLAQFEAQLAALLDSAKLGGESFGLVLTCQGALGKLEELAHQGASYSHRWFPVMVPCLGMVTPSWILQALTHGAEAVAFLSCSTDCPFGQEQAVQGRVDYCHRLLRNLGQGDRVRVLNAQRPEELLQVLREEPPPQKEGAQRELGERLHLGTLHRTSQAIQRLAGANGVLPSVALEHPHSPFGVLEFQGEGCTACLACAEACPAGALASECSGDELTLTWLASSCTGCGMCADACPEKAADLLRVRRMTNLGILSGGSVVFHRDRLATCEGCGASIASGALLQRLEGVLEGSNEALRAVLRRYCATCRVSVGLGTEPSPVHDPQALVGSERPDQG